MNTYWVNERSARGSSSSAGLRLSQSQADSMMDLLKRTGSEGSLDSSDGAGKSRLRESGPKRRKSRMLSTLLSKVVIDKIGEEDESMEYSSPDINNSGNRRRSSRSDQAFRRSNQSDQSVRRSGKSDNQSDQSARRSGKSDAGPPEEALRALRKEMRNKGAEPIPIGAAGEPGV